MEPAEIADRTAIQDCIHRYCRGIDRRDEAALRSAYWPDATDRHGPYSGSATGFIDWALGALARSERSIHHVSNILIAFKSETVALVEACFSARQRQPDALGVMRQWDLAGRYLDRFEKRGDAWRIAERTVVYDWVEEQPLPVEGEAERFGIRVPIGGQWPDDPLYGFLNQRP